jgi:class 3 adenylate cyclase
MFTDIVGYTALVGESEKKAFEILSKNKDFQRLLIKKYKGEWLEEIGVGMLAIFNSVSEAFRCGLDISKEVKNQNISL